MKQSSKDITQAVIDAMLRHLAAGGFLTAALLLPNSAQVLSKSLDSLLGHLDKSARQRERRRILYYMKQQGLIVFTPYDYQHGIVLTKKGQQRLDKKVKIVIEPPQTWDKNWRLVFFDIPEELKPQRNSLTRQLKGLEFQQLQKSIWVHPYPCRDQIAQLCEQLKIRQFVTYVEISHIDNEKQLKKRFKDLL